MKVAVTGAAGRVGRAVLAELRQASGYAVWALDRTLVAAERAQRSLLVDLKDAGEVYGALAGADAVIHLGAIPNVAHHAGEYVYVNNTAACANVAAACKAYGIERVVYASSITIYGLEHHARSGALTALPAGESVPAHPGNFYSLSKWAGEEIFTMAAGDGRLHVASLRLALVIGPDEYATRGRPRDERNVVGGMWAYVDSRDVAQAARRAVERLGDLGPGNHAFNVGAADAHAREPLSALLPRYVPDLAPLAAGLTGSAPGYSIEKARRELAYEPRYSWRTELGE